MYKKLLKTIMLLTALILNLGYAQAANDRDLTDPSKTSKAVQVSGDGAKGTYHIANSRVVPFLEAFNESKHLPY